VQVGKDAMHFRPPEEQNIHKVFFFSKFSKIVHGFLCLAYREGCGASSLHLELVLVKLL
jgi:hypothetical protein